MSRIDPVTSHEWMSEWADTPEPLPPTPPLPDREALDAIARILREHPEWNPQLHDIADLVWETGRPVHEESTP